MNNKNKIEELKRNEIKKNKIDKRKCANTKGNEGKIDVIRDTFHDKDVKIDDICKIIQM